MKRCMILFLFINICFIVFAETLTIEEAVRLAIQNNLTIKQNAFELENQKMASDRAWNVFFPQANAGLTRNRPLSIVESVPKEIDRWTPGYQLSAGIELSLASVSNIRSIKADYNAGRLNFELAKKDLETQVRKLFYQIVLINANRSIATQNLESTTSRHEQSVALVRIGQVASLDELNARVDMENSRLSLKRINTDYLNAIDQFKTILGISVNEAVTLEGTLDIHDTDIPESKLNTQAQSLETLALMSSIESLKAQRMSTLSSAFLPTFQMSWNSAPQYQYDYTTEKSNWFDQGSYSMSLNLNLDGFIPFSRTQTQIANLNNNIKSAQLRLNETNRNRQDRINQISRLVNNTAESIEILKLNMEATQTTYNIYMEMYLRGAIDFQNIRDASQNLLNAQYQMQQEHYNLISAILDLEKELNVPFGSIK